MSGVEIELFKRAFLSFKEKTVCDTFLPETLSVGENKSTIENLLFEPQIIYGELYKMVENDDGIKSLQKIEFPEYYFQDAQKGIDE